MSGERSGEELFEGSEGSGPHEQDGGHLSGGSSRMGPRGMHGNGMQTATAEEEGPVEARPKFPHEEGELESESPISGHGKEGEAWGGEPFEAHDEHHESFEGEHGGGAGERHADSPGIPHELHKTGHPGLSREQGKKGFINAVVAHLREGKGRRG